MATNLGTAYVRIEPSAKGIGNSIENVLNNEAGSAGTKAGSKIASGIGGALKVGGAVIGAGIAAATGAVMKFGSEAVSSYANYEQLIGGVEKLYGDAAGKIEQFANDAYKTSGMSANQYMETATGFSAALINSLEGDVDKAAELTDVAMRAMSDNVNVFGSDMESVQNAFQGFAKGNYTMLDNLKLGYGGTKEGMEQLIEDANKYRESIGETADLSINSFADIVQAVQSVQEAQNIAGTTNKEAMSTIEGSATATKAAWENVITAIGKGEGLNEAFDGLMSSIFGGEDGGGLLNNVLPRIEQVMQGIGEFVATAAPIISEKLPALIEGIVPSLLSSGVELISALAQGLIQALPTLMPIAVDVLMQLANTIIANLPMIISVGVEILGQLITGIAQALPELIPAAVDAILTIADGLIDNIDLVIDASVQIIVGIIEGLVRALPKLIEKAPIIIEKLIVGLIGAIPKLVLAAGQIIVAFINAINNIAPKLQEVGKNLVAGLKNGIINAWNGMVQKVKDMANNLVQSVKGVFGIASPSKVFAQIGDYCVQGFDDGMSTFGEGALVDVENAMDDISAVAVPTFEADMSMRAGSYTSVDNSGDLYGLLSQYLPLLERDTKVNVSLEGDAEGLFRQIRTQANTFTRSTGASPFLSPA